MAAALRLHLAELKKLVICSLCSRLTNLATCPFCNHHFCMACILQVTSEEKTSISGNGCPKCNKQYIPQTLTNLYPIYQGLELGLASLRPCCRETYKDFKEQGGMIKKVKRKHRREKNNVDSLHQMSEGVLKKDAVGSSNQIPESVVEGNEGATFISLNQRLECREEREEEAGVVFANQMRPVEGEKKATVASSQKKRVKKRRKLEREDVTSLHQRSERDNETFVGSLNQRPESLVKGNEGAALVSSNLRSECVVEGEEKIAVVSLIERLRCVQGGEKEASVASMNQLLPCAVEGQKEASVFLNQKSAEGEKEAAVGSLNQRLACAAEGEREAFVASSTARSACVEEGGKEASLHCVEVPMDCASKKKKKRKRVVSYKGHPTMSKRVQLPCPLLEDSEEQKTTASLLQKTCPIESEVLQINTDASKEGLSVVLSGNVIGVMAQHNRTKSISTNNHVISGNDSGKQQPKSQMELDLNSETLAECKPKQNILVLDELSCVFCQAPLNSQVAGPMMHYARGVPVQAGTRIKSLVSVCTSALCGMIRTSSHQLEIEFGRFQGIPPEDRLYEVGAAARTLKFMFATLSGIWILKSDWLKACVAAYQLVGEETYEVNLDIHRMVGGPRRVRLLAASRSHKLLENIEFYFLGDYAAAYKMDLQALVSAAGGRIEDDCWNADEMQTCTRVVVYNANRMPAVAGPEAVKNRRSQAKSVAHKARAHVVAHTWILDTIAAYELQPFYQ
ncbi:hypothetical protein L7F22_058029 [Adiantum nelumboides]|nr:hypothetical protein [Adiantum nelumboides]